METSQIKHELPGEYLSDAVVDDVNNGGKPDDEGYRMGWDRTLKEENPDDEGYRMSWEKTIN